MTQCERILAYMDQHGGITQMDANRLSITRLAARIYDLRQRGIEITEEPVTGKNEYGPYRCSRYKRAVQE